jgi:malonyl-CoA O-methyltransferase
MKTIAESFARAAPRYSAHSPVQQALSAWLAEWLPAQRAGAALEMGAGPGIFTAHTQPWAGHYLATDIAPAMCAQGAANFPRLQWQPAAAEQPPSGPWDFILSASMLQWVADPAAVFSAWRAQLAPGGRVLMGLYAAPSLPELRSLTEGWAPLTWRSPSAWIAALVKAGLRVQRSSRERRRFIYPSARACLRSLHSLGAAPQTRVSPARLRTWLDAQPPGEFTATWTFLRLEAEIRS